MTDPAHLDYEFLFEPRRPWAHQLDGVALTIHAINQGEHCCLTAPTGGGKTACIIAMMRWCQQVGKRVILYTNRILLTEQTCRAMDEYGIDYGVIAATEPKRKALLRDVQVARTQTVQRRVLGTQTEELWPADVVLMDEAHSMATGKNLEIIDAHKAQGAVCVGITATPVEVDHVYPKLIIGGTVSGCRNVGALVPAVYKAPSELDFSKLEVKSNGEFSIADIRREWTPKIIGHVYDSWAEHNPDARPALGFAPGVPESIWFVDEFEKRGVRAAHVDGEDVYVDGVSHKKNREIYEDTIQRWKGGEIKILWNRYVLREGIDFPWMYHLILATPIGSLKGFIQTAGRVLRYSDETPDYVLITDHAGNYYRHKYSPNQDIPWRDLYHKGQNALSSEHKDYLAYNPDDIPLSSKEADDKEWNEPVRCPRCHTLIKKGRQCPPSPMGCGFRITRRSRAVIQKNGRLKEVDRPAVAPRRVKERSNTVRIWEQCFHRCSKSGQNLRQARGLFFYENHYWPPNDLPLMPRDPADWSRKCKMIDKAKLYTKEEYEERRAIQSEGA